RRTEAYLFELDPVGTWHPARLDDGCVADGKVETYERLVAAILGPAETFFTSVFSAQGKRSLSAYRNSEIKSLLADLLGLERIREEGARAADVVRQLKAGLSVMRQEVGKVADELQAAERDVAGLAGAGQRAMQASQRKAARAAGLGYAQKQLAQAQARAEAESANTARRQDLHRQRARLAENAKADAARVEAALRDVGQRESRLQQRIADRRTRTAQRKSALQRQIEGARRSASDAARVSRAQRRVQLTEQIAELRQQRMARAIEAVRERSEVESRVLALRRELEAVEREAGQVALRQQDLTRRLGLADAVPCAGTDLQGRCQLLGDSNEAKALRLSVDAAVGQLAERRRQVRDQAQQANGELLKLRGADGAEAAALRTLNLSRSRAKHYGLLAARAGEVAQAGRLLEAALAELEMLDHGEQTHAEDETAEAAQLAGERQKQRAETAQALLRAAREDARLGDELAAIPTFDTTSVARAAAAVRQARAQLDVEEAAEQQALRLVEREQVARQQLAQIVTRFSAAEKQTGAVEAELGYWNLLAKGLSNDGVIALEIDDAGPTLAALANDLLLASYGPRFTVEVCTQTATAKGEQRETFEIVVHDGVRDESKSLRLVSGGERVWINECLTRAIALYLSENTGRRFGTLFCDEADGPLDPAHKRMFMDMKREVLRLGGYEREYFVSQTPALTEMADLVIDLDAMAEAAE
ncbi:MAG TPA: DNA repair protein, partial [Burkholderiaceae bacterium]|nr:DNA repair protein [Burkholderiaceae bacterium]